MLQNIFWVNGLNLSMLLLTSAGILNYYEAYAGKYCSSFVSRSNAVCFRVFDSLLYLVSMKMYNDTFKFQTFYFQDGSNDTAS